MKVVVQRVKEGSVAIGGAPYAKIGKGYVIFLGIGTNDAAADADFLAEKGNLVTIVARSPARDLARRAPGLFPDRVQGGEDPGRPRAGGGIDIRHRERGRALGRHYHARYRPEDHHLPP